MSNKHHNRSSTVGKFFLLTLLVVAIDQFTKNSANDIVRNEGILFGLSFGNSNEVMIGASIAAAIIIFIITFFSHARGKILYSLILGGIIGNLSDRIMYGYVVDFIRWGNWPVFNIADAAISTSVVLLLIYTIWDNNTYGINRDRLMNRLRH